MIECSTCRCSLEWIIVAMWVLQRQCYRRVAAMEDAVCDCCKWKIRDVINCYNESKLQHVMLLVVARTDGSSNGYIFYSSKEQTKRK